jgi:alpha/beta superfamily hydrolase
MSAGPATISVEDGITLEARWDVLDSPRGVVVLCHPHPLYGGNMQLPLLRTVAACLVDAGCAVLRFNFRGAGSSTGTWSGGPGELADLAAACRAARAAFPDLPLRLAGWSFGAVMALHWQSDQGSRHRLAAIAPPTRIKDSPPLPDPSSLAPAPRLFLIGSRDQYADLAVLESYAAALGAELRVLPGSDHFLYGREHRVGEAVAAHLAGADG